MKNRIGIDKWVSGPITRWVILLIWLVAAGLLNTLAPPISKEVVNNAPPLTDARPSVQASELVLKEYPNAEDALALFVWHRQGGLTDTDLQRIQQFTERLSTHPVPYQTSVPPLHQMSLQALKTKLSDDGSTIVSPVFFSKSEQSNEWKEGVDQAKEEATDIFGSDPFAVAIDSPADLNARVTGPVGIQIDATGVFGQADKTLLFGTVLLVLVLLLLIYRSPILAMLPLVAVGIAYSVISPILGWMVHSGMITVEKQGTNIMTVLLFGAGTDYCLFLIYRFRQLLKTEPDKGKALRGAITGSSGAIAISGLTVILSLLTMIVAEYGSFRLLAAPFGISIFIMVLASLTLVPALLAIMGRASFWPFIPRTPGMLAERAKRKGQSAPTSNMPSRNIIGTLVVRRPWLIIVLTCLVLGGFAVFSTQVKFTFDKLAMFPKTMASIEGFSVIGEQFSPGELAPVKVIVDTGGKDRDVAQTLASLPYVTQVSEPQAGNMNPAILAYDVRLNLNPYSTEAMNLIPELRQTVKNKLNQLGDANAAKHVWISGVTAEQYDTKETNIRDMSIILPLIILMIATLLVVYLRSLIAATYLILTVLLSYLSALGLGWIVLHHFLGMDVIQGTIPLYSFVFLIALGEDYNIFVISSIWQKSKHMPLKQAVLEGVGETGSVITSAGLILAGTFAVLITMPVQLMLQMGVIVALGILLDTFVVRPFLVPAITLLLGRWAFWPGRRNSGLGTELTSIEKQFEAN
ncbi:MMPL family transporter [Bacillus sp. FJAT-49732]|uniref:MMPL family transporter n=1 Tax=Lederbergia citrisecunda TaxID=2833583 RepID=A0A942YPG2_9BACI|nr:MMPL family transporter [Lederbergia citrisecunda]MBS4201276.1 MMPL family transporter [Lederbergia citrisecunda]